MLDDGRIASRKGSLNILIHAETYYVKSLLNMEMTLPTMTRKMNESTINQDKEQCTDRSLHLRRNNSKPDRNFEVDEPGASEQAGLYHMDV